MILSYWYKCIVKLLIYSKIIVVNTQSGGISMELLQVLERVVGIYKNMNATPQQKEKAYQTLANKQNVVSKSRLDDYRDAIKVTRIRNMFAEMSGKPFDPNLSGGSINPNSPGKSATANVTKSRYTQGKYEDKLVDLYLEDNRDSSKSTTELIEELASIIPVIDADAH